MEGQMTDIILSQAEADALIAIRKDYDGTSNPAGSPTLTLPDLGGKLIVPLICTNKREKFSLDITRSRIDLLKETKQIRGRQVIVLVRLDVGGAPHRNPDDEEIPSPHLHIYREGFGDKWACAVPSDKFSNLSDPWQTLYDFMKYCNIVGLPEFNRGLFT